MPNLWKSRHRSHSPRSIVRVSSGPHSLELIHLEESLTAPHMFQPRWLFHELRRQLTRLGVVPRILETNWTRLETQDLVSTQRLLLSYISVESTNDSLYWSRGSVLFAIGEVFMRKSHASLSQRLLESDIKGLSEGVLHVRGVSFLLQSDLVQTLEILIRDSLHCLFVLLPNWSN